MSLCSAKITNVRLTLIAFAIATPFMLRGQSSQPSPSSSPAAEKTRVAKLWLEELRTADPVKKAAVYKELTSLGDSKGTFNYAIAFLGGDGVSKNIVEGQRLLQILRENAEKGSGEAAYVLVALEDHPEVGDGKGALYWLSLSAKLNYYDGVADLSQRLLSGDVVEKGSRIEPGSGVPTQDGVDAGIRLIVQSLRLPQSSDPYNRVLIDLAHYFLTGDVVKRDSRRGIDLLSLGVDTGDIAATGRMLFELLAGENIPLNVAEAARIISAVKPEARRSVGLGIVMAVDRLAMKELKTIESTIDIVVAGDGHSLQTLADVIARAKPYKGRVTARLAPGTSITGALDNLISSMKSSTRQQ